MRKSQLNTLARGSGNIVFCMMDGRIKEHGSKPRVLVIVGATCTGKTALAAAIARRMPVEIISADSRQIYRLLDIGTAKPSKEILAKTPHHFIDILNPEEEYNAAKFGNDARKTIAEIYSRDRLPIVAGGSGLYIRSLCDGLFKGPGKDEAIRRKLEFRIIEEGAEVMLRELRVVDPGATMTIETLHRRRLIHALETYYATGIPLTQWQAHKIDIPFRPVFVGLRWERQELYKMINARVDDMMRTGLMDEAMQLREKGYDDSLQSLNTPGYKELFAHLRGEITLERAIILIKQHTRNYAKRQTTWFNGDERIRWIDMNESSVIENIAVEIGDTI